MSQATEAREATTSVSGSRRPGTRRTLLALLACALGAFPLKALLSDTRWLGDAWLAMVVVVGPAALLRLRRAPSALDVWPGIVLLVPLLTRIYVPHHAWAGFIPTKATFSDVGDLMDSLHRTTSDEVAPIHSTVAVRLVLSALLGLLAALIDLIAVVGRRGALAGVPLLVVYTVSGAVPREPVGWAWFALAAAGYLILLSLDAADELREWGRRVSRKGGDDPSRLGLAFSAQRIGVIAVAAAVALPWLVPSNTHNLISKIFHNPHGGSFDSFGVNPGSTIDPYVSLKGQLQRDKPVPLMTVHVETHDPAAVPFYARVNVLPNFTGDGWLPEDGHGTEEPIAGTTYATDPASGHPRTVGYRATVTISGYGGNAPVFNVPSEVTGLDSQTQWSRQDMLLLGPNMTSGTRFTEEVEQPNPTLDQLRAPAATVQPDMSQWLQLVPLPSFVTNLVNRLTAGATTSYDKAQAIFHFFTNPANHFTYTLSTDKGDSGSDLVDFLQHRRGFCQQYAGALGVMLRAAGVPARIVLGYMHAPPDGKGDFEITTFDAHSWVEAFFPGAGWIPFDPTPTAGLIGGKALDLPWAQHSYGPVANPGGSDSVLPKTTPPPSHSVSPGSNVGQGSSGGSGSGIDGGLLITLLVIVALAGTALVPATVRWSRRRTRLGAARRGDTDALWAELSDTAVDLGYVWSDARSPRQVAAWLANDAGDTAPALSDLATAVEQRRYARVMRVADPDELSEGLLAVSDQLWSRRSSRVRFWARFWPASLGWGKRLSAASNMLRRRH
jgi:transglutaminase-like putative cysteine protease